jgi:hypothetical protein
MAVVMKGLRKTAKDIEDAAAYQILPIIANAGTANVLHDLPR